MIVCDESLPRHRRRRHQNAVPLADESRVLARATIGTVKLMRVGEPEATARLQAMLAEVAAAAGVSLGQVTRTCFGLAGICSPAVRAWASRVLSEFSLRRTSDLRRRGDRARCSLRGRAGDPGRRGHWIERHRTHGCGRDLWRGRLGACAGRRGIGHMDRAGSASRGPARTGPRAVRRSFNRPAPTRIATPSDVPLPCCARSSGTGSSTRSANWLPTPTNAAIAATPRRSSPRSRPWLRAAPSRRRACRRGPDRAGVELAELVALVYRKMTSTTRAPHP